MMANMLSSSISQIKGQVSDARLGLPKEVFGLISELTPLVNVDLLIKNERGQTLLTWREDEYYGASWHIPGGIIRFKETAGERIAKVADSELNMTVKFINYPIHITEIISNKRDYRGHFISLLYLCSTNTEPSPSMNYSICGLKNGAWKWHERSPENLISPHNVFRSFIDNRNLLKEHNFL
jgi:ADP-ribose pyrophosphatase YjhB (NUDIX family)